MPPAHLRYPMLPIPALPQHSPLPAGLTEQDLLALTRTPHIQPAATPDHLTLSVAVADCPAGYTPVLYLDSHTHIQREHLSHFALQPYIPAGPAAHRWHAGSFELPQGLNTAVGILRANPATDFCLHPDDRQAWIALRDTGQPAWAKGEIIGSGQGRFNALVDMAPLAEFPAGITPAHSTTIDAGVPCQVWLHLSAGSTSREILLVTDGDIYVRHVPLLPALTQLADAPSATIFLAPTVPERRMDLLGNPELLAHTARAALTWARNTARAQGHHLDTDAQRVTIAGGSLGGYAATSMVLHFPDIARNAITQSVSLWWPGPSNQPYALLDQPLPQATDSPRTIFHEVGEFDIHLYVENKLLAG
ncbi:hypothetical protein G7Y31_08405 [Corynebacterium lizhenjunii]|uniref:Enterochelin esterase n=1 Tax=Corynebacterium lizhenjunii TaxID=2709394 RepID=A0A7T0KF62_9CORY|nr:alpha/beta hydrolase-fold protein [Corynebacterium lizhenjunii]QPK78573.1 hypothetical protein G7Y31_08405 [Corynebacterium lizhenjunii]